MKKPLQSLTDAEIDALLRRPTAPACADFDDRLAKAIQRGPKELPAPLLTRLIRWPVIIPLAAAAALVLLLSLPSIPEPVSFAAIIEEEVFLLSDYLAGIDVDTFEALAQYASVY